MIVTLEEAKLYLRIDNSDEDTLIIDLIKTAEQLCMDIARVDSTVLLDEINTSRIAVLYTIAYLYENREKAEYDKLGFTIRAILFGIRRDVF